MENKISKLRLVHNPEAKKEFEKIIDTLTESLIFFSEKYSEKIECLSEDALYMSITYLIILAFRSSASWEEVKILIAECLIKAEKVCENK